MMLQVGGAFLLALMGTPHCVAMCGPIALANARPIRSCTPAQPRVVHVARGVGYVTLGVLAGSAVPLVSRLGADAFVRGGAKLACGAVLLLVGLLSSGLIARLVARLRHARSSTHPTPATACQVPADRELTVSLGRARASAFIRGLLWSLLPCGLIYAGLGLSLTAGSPVAGGLVMLAFFLGTLPSMTFVLAALRTLEGRMSLHRVRLATGLIVALGGLLQVEAAVATLRGAHAAPTSEAAPTPPPCH